ncbi:MAG: phosphotransferase, partial [Acidimicrobiia bacterium]|nr:phosphotransferase [Acidimicrobiia bacterium]
MTSLVPPHWLVAQRWYGAADRRLVGLSDVDSAALGPSLQGGELTWLLVEASFESGDPAHFQIVWDAVAGRDRADDPAVLRFAFPGLDFDSVELLAGEQSNTSLVVRTPSGDLVAKLFRRPPPGPNPDAEVVRALWDVGFRQLPEPVGEFRRSGRDLAVIRRRVPGAIDGWAMALEDPDAMLRGADELGRLTAQMHVALAAAFGSRRVSGQGWAVLHRALVDELSAGGALDAAQARRLVRPADALAGLADAGSAIRVHGDLHLGQVLRSEGRWYVLDFEGEPARPLEARRERSSALRDV